MDNMDLMKGIGIGFLAGCAISVALSSGRRKRKKCKTHTIKALGKVANNVTDLLGF